jgi:peptidoglycan hydrolase CwlO-like protein
MAAATVQLRGLKRPLCAALLISMVALVAALPPVASADTRSRLGQAKARLATLTQQIQTQESLAAQLRSQLRTLDAKIADAKKKAEGIASRLADTQRQLRAAQAEYESLRSQLDALARNEYILGPGSGLEVILGATSIGDLNDRIQMVSQMSLQDVTLADRMQNLAAQLATKKRSLNHLLAEQTALLQDLGQQQAAKGSAIAAEAAALASLDRTRSQIVTLVAGLTRQLRAEELASLGGVFQGNAHTTYGRWAGLLLQTMGVSGCHANMIAVVAWQVAEFTQAGWNPLATTYPMPGATLFNSFGVRNYVSLGQGLAATRLTIRGGWSSHGYAAIVSSMSRCADPMTTAQAINASDWCRGCAGGTYVTGIIQKVEADYRTYAAL